MFPWFDYKGVDSRSMGLWIKELPAPARAEERVENIEVPGRAGHLTMKQGEYVHNSRLMECIVQAPFTADFDAILAWLTGDGKVIFSNDETHVYEAEITAEIKFNKVSNTIKEATIPFFVQPYKSQNPPEADITITGTSGSITNPGNVESLPIVEITYTGDIKVTLGGSPMEFVGIDTKITVDCGAEIILDKDGNLWTGTYGGDFWKFQPGAVSVAADSSCTLKITPRWRWT